MGQGITLHIMILDTIPSGFLSIPPVKNPCY